MAAGRGRRRCRPPAPQAPPWSALERHRFRQFHPHDPPGTPTGRWPPGPRRAEDLAFSPDSASPPPALGALRPHQTKQKADQLAAGMAWQDGGLVFTTHQGGRLEPRNVNRSWYVVRSRAQLGSIRLHDLRHSCASFLLAAGASPRTVMKTFGHSQIGLTMNTCTHVLPEIEREAIDAAAKVIFE